MPAHELQVIKHAGERPLFTGTIPPGIGEQDYLCGRGNEPVLTRVDQRQASPAVSQCPCCSAFNVVATRGEF